MERLTIRGDHGIFMAPGYDFHIDPDDYDLVQDILARLADYEDTGLEPEQVKDMAENAETRLLTWFESRYGFPVGELMGMCEAKQQGRLVELPCKIGDILWDRNADPWKVISPEWFDINVVHLHCVSPATGRRGTLVVGKKSIGKTVFLTREQALEGGLYHAEH